MPHSRFFLDTLFQVDAESTLSGDEAYHLQRVMRKREGEVVELVNGRNQLAKATILSLEKKYIQLRILEIEEKFSDRTIILCQALPRLNRLDTIVEKGTELGMTELWLFPGQLSEKKELTSLQIKRLESISVAAMKQCGRLDLPKIILKPSLFTWNYSYQHYLAYFGEFSAAASPFYTVLPKEKNILFFIGPESGFTLDEESHLRQNNVIGVRLHPNILRTDTAAIAALSMIAS